MMQHASSRLVLSLVALSVCQSAVAHAAVTTLTLNPTADTRVVQASPTKNYGTAYLATTGKSAAQIESALMFNVTGATFPLASAFHAATGHLFAIFAVTPLTVLLQVAAAVFVGVMSAIAPAWSSSRLRIVDGLRAVS